jgi:hypothetical protein
MSRALKPTPCLGGIVAIVLSCVAPAAWGDVGVPAGIMRPPPAPAHPTATAQERLAAAQLALESAQAALARTNASLYGENLAKAKAATAQALVDLTAALAFVRSHPTLNVLPNGPAPAETPVAHPLALPAGDSLPGVNLLTAVEGLNVALNQLLNNPAPDYHGPVMTELGGFREKIMADIGRASVALFAAVRDTRDAAEAAAENARRKAEEAAPVPGLPEVRSQKSEVSPTAEPPPTTGLDRSQVGGAARS